MKVSGFFPIALALMATAAGCARHEEAPDLTHALRFSSITARKVYTLEDTAREFNRDADVTFTDSASVILPDVLFGLDVAPLRDRILDVAFDTVCPDPCVAIDAAFANTANSMGYNAVETSANPHDDGIDGFSYVRADIYSLTSERLTYSVSKDTYYPGAAHGMQNRSFITFDLTAGDIITLDEIFTPAGLEELPSIISRRARRLASQLGQTNITSLPEGGDFYVSLEDEIVFVYQPYEVASYAQGMIYVPFYPYELSEYLTPRGLRFFGLND